MTAAWPLVVVAGVVVAMIALALGHRVHHPAVRRPAGAIGEASTRGVDVDDLLDVVDDVARHVRAGASLPSSVALALDRRPSCIRPVGRMLRSGATLSDAVAAASSDAAERDGDERLVLQTLAACVRSGGNLSAPIERAALVLRERRTWQRERRMQSAQARLSASVMTLLPIAFALWGAATSTSVRSAYSASAVAGVCAAAGLALNLTGWLWMRHLVGGRSP